VPPGIQTELPTEPAAEMADGSSNDFGEVKRPFTESYEQSSKNSRGRVSKTKFRRSLRCGK
jgi:hypothetical protein